MKTFNLLTLQTTKACNLQCRYCYLEPNGAELKEKISIETTKKIFSDIVNYHVKNDINSRIWVVYHGGETLILGHKYFKEALEHQVALEEKIGKKIFSNSIQSNITLLDQEYCNLFKDHNVNIGTSIDGPNYLHNRNRYSKKVTDNHKIVMDKVKLARDYGLSVGAICIITKDKVNYIEEIFEFFLEAKMNFKTNRLFINGRAKKYEHDLNVEEKDYASFLCKLFDLWYRKTPEIIIENLMQFIGLVLAGQGAGGCSSGNCATKHITITPNGDCYTCGRTTQNKSFFLGNISVDDFEKISQTETIDFLTNRIPKNIKECLDCEYKNLCFSGCMYEAYLKNNTIYSPDGNCEVFKTLYSHIQSKIISDLTSYKHSGGNHA